MFAASPRYGSAHSRYRDIDVAARVHGASPHGLVTIMFDELLKALDSLVAAERAPGSIHPGAIQSRGVSILHGLEAALDHERGGEIAANLGRIYREARRLIATNGPGRADALDQARAMIGDIAGAWNTIA